MNLLYKYVICIDFDNTIVNTGIYPDIKGIKPYAKKVINSLHELGHIIIVSTCRINEHAEAARKFLDDNGIHYDYFNENLPSRIEHYGGDCRKISADVYFDDHAYPCEEIDWLKFGEWIIRKSIVGPVTLGNV